eukprot:788899_1
MMLMMIMMNTTGTNIIQTLSKKIFKFNIHLSEETGDKYAYKQWMSWFWWIVYVINMLVGVKEDLLDDGSVTNAVCGLLLCMPFSWPTPIKSLSVTQNTIGEYYTYVNKDESVFEFRQDGLSLLWIITYTSCMGFLFIIWPKGSCVPNLAWYYSFRS